MAVPMDAKKGFWLVIGASVALFVAAWVAGKIPG
jgi:hypothetical protein